MKRSLHDTEASYEALGAVLDIAKIIPVTDEDILTAYLMKASDFEDCLLAICTRSIGSDMIATRNSRDFNAFNVRTVEPEDFLNVFSL